MWSCTEITRDPLGIQELDEVLYVTKTFGAPLHFNDSISPELVQLGKQLFFDPRLSANGKVSCGSCHLPELAFSDGTSLTNQGVSGKDLKRHAPALMNLAWKPRFFWDGGVATLEFQVLGPLTHPDEMDNTMQAVLDTLEHDPVLKKAFQSYFGTPKIESRQVMIALAVYERSLISANSHWDLFRQGKRTLSPIALRGEKLFYAHCSTCHSPGLFSDNRYHNNGLDRLFVYQDEGHETGRYRLTGDSSQLGAYLTPTLRNIAVTAPYMHDGRFSDLDAVLEHYSAGIQDSPSLAPELKKLNGGFRFSSSEREELKAFLETLTDSTFLTKHKNDTSL